MSSHRVNFMNIQRHVVISSCKTYRYTLTCFWGGRDHPARSLAFLMLNPSTEDHAVDDPTIRRCMGFARREGYDGIMVANLSAYRTAYPRELLFARNPVGPDNNKYIRKCLACGDIVAAWGSNGIACARAPEIKTLLAGRALKCLGVNKNGSPKHPLYIPADAPLVPWV